MINKNFPIEIYWREILLLSWMKTNVHKGCSCHELFDHRNCIRSSFPTLFRIMIFKILKHIVFFSKSFKSSWTRWSRIPGPIINSHGHVTGRWISSGNEGRTRVSPSIYSIESVQARKSCATWRNESCPMLSAFCGLGLFPLYWNIRPQHYGNYQGNRMSASGSHEGAEGGLRGRGRSGKRGRPCVETDSCRSPIHTHHPDILHSEKLCHISMKKHRYSHWQ